jgi:hypothetical protein
VKETQLRHGLRGIVGEVTRSAVRLTYRQLAQLDALDDGRLPIAEVHRRWARWSVEHGLSHPSYERTRLLLHELRALRRRDRERRQELLVAAFGHGNPLLRDRPQRNS